MDDVDDGRVLASLGDASRPHSTVPSRRRRAAGARVSGTSPHRRRRLSLVGDRGGRSTPTSSRRNGPAARPAPSGTSPFTEAAARRGHVDELELPRSQSQSSTRCPWPLRRTTSTCWAREQAAYWHAVELDVLVRAGLDAEKPSGKTPLHRERSSLVDDSSSATATTGMRPRPRGDRVPGLSRSWNASRPDPEHGRRARTFEPPHPRRPDRDAARG